MLRKLSSHFAQVSTKRIAAVLIVVAAGTYLLTGSHAASPYVSTTTSTGSVSNGAQSVTGCNGSSNGSCVVFKQAIPMDGNVALALSTPGTPFAASSFWNSVIPSNTPLNINSAAYISNIPNNGTLNTSTYSAPLYVVPANQPYVSVTRVCGGVATLNTAFDNAVAGGVPIPSDAHAAVGTDGEIQIYQPSTDKYWDFWRLVKDTSGNWDACWGGVINGVSQSNGIFPSDTGATATSLPLLGGVVRIDELQAGKVDHAIGLILPNNLSENVIPANTPGATNGISWPATRTDGTDSSPLAIPEGLRLQLNPSLDLSTLDLTPVAKAIAVAAQKYGFVVYDSAPSTDLADDIRLGDQTTYTAAGLPNPYTSGPGVGGVGNSGLFDGVNQGLIMKNFPWNQLQALPLNYGESSGS